MLRPSGYAGRSRASRVPTLSFHHRETISPPWTEVPSLSLGEGEAREHLLVAEDGVPLRRLDLCRDGSETWFKVEAVAWDDLIVVGFAARVYLLRGATVACWFRLSDYFCGLHPGDGWLLIASGTNVTRMDQAGQVMWRSARLAIDGVIIERVASGVVEGQGEWDPPGGWKAFRIRLADGKVAS